MDLIGAALVFVSLACAGFLAGIFLVVARFTRTTAEQQAEAIEAAEQHRRELRSQLTAATATILDRVQLVAAGLAAQLQATAAEQRNDLRLAGLLPPLRVPGEEPQGGARTRATPPSGTPAIHVSSPGRPAASVTTRPGFTRTGATLRDDEATPPSGWSLAQIRARTAQVDEERPA